MRWVIFSILFVVPILAQAEEIVLTKDAKIWDQRQEEIVKIGKDLAKVLRKNGRVVQKGLESSRVYNLVAQTIQSANRRLKARGLYIQESLPQKPEEKKFALTGIEIEQILNSLEPVQREFAEESLFIKKVTGRFLHGRTYSIDSVPENIDAKPIFDLENFEPTKFREIDSLIEDFRKRVGKRAVAILLPQVELSDGSYSASPRFTIEQLSNGNLQVFQERRKARRADLMSIQVIGYAPRTLVIITKGEFISSPKLDGIQKSAVITSFAEGS